MAEGVHIVCARCDSVNRIAPGKSAGDAVCGRCSEKLFDGRPAEVGDAGLFKQISRNDIPVVVDFWADWCAPCRSMAPGFAATAQAFEPRVRFLKVDVDRHKQAAAQFKVSGVPALFVFRGGEIVARQAGALDPTSLRNWILASTRAS